ncbi:MAG: glycosyltransferase [Clostridia bacterium]|nr:glycosyltransferase [Clostridia bacterium]
MKMIFIHDNRFWKKGDIYYSYGHFAYDLLWKRYLNYFDEIVVGGRIEETDDETINDKFSVSSGENVSFFGLPNLMSFSGLKEYKKAKKKLTEEMKKADCAVIRLPSNLGYLACKIAEKHNIKYMIEVVGCTWDDLWNYGSLLGRIYAPISFLIEKKCVRKAQNVLYVSRRFLQKRYPNKHFNMGCSDTNISPCSEEVFNKRIEKIRNMNDDTPIRIGLIASLNVGYKGHDTAMLALKNVLKSHKNVTLCFLGDGDKTKWEKMAKDLGVIDNIEFSGVLPGGDAVLKWIDNLDIFVMPSLQETLGRALIEAMSRGCPCIGGAGTAVPEQLPDDCVHRRKDYKELGDMICYMIENKKYTELCATENYHRSKKYSEEVLLERRTAFFKKVLSK